MWQRVAVSKSEIADEKCNKHAQLQLQQEQDDGEQQEWHQLQEDSLSTKLDALITTYPSSSNKPAWHTLPICHKVPAHAT